MEETIGMDGTGGAGGEAPPPAGVDGRQALLLAVSYDLLRAGFDEPALAQKIFDTIAAHFDADVCFNYRLDGEGLELMMGAGIPAAMMPAARRLQLGQAFCGTVAACRAPLAADAERIAGDERGAFVRAMGVRAYACHPLFARDGSVMGTLSLASTRRDAFSPEDVDFLQTVAHFLALAWERGKAEREILRLNADLERRVEQRTRELAEANAALSCSNRELQHFAHAAAHDLQTPLRSIASFAQLLQRECGGRLGERADTCVAQVVDNTRRMQALVGDLLAYARLDAQSRPFEPVDLGRLCGEVRGNLAAALAEAGAELQCGELPEVPGDRVQLAQLLQNLVENGIKYNDSGTPRVAVTAERQGGEWVISVRDNGIGIDPRYHGDIFEIFRRLHSQQAYPGSGIGLAICRRVVVRHGGRLWVESSEGEGSTFHFSLAAGTGDGQ